MREIISPLDGIRSPFGPRRGGAPFTPALLFASGEQGVWYDPSDFSTLFQDSAGTTPVTAVEQPVGLMLDKSKGLAIGSDLLAPLNFSTFATSGGPVTIDSATAYTAAATANVYKAVLTVGKWYRVTINATFTSSALTLYNATSALNTIGSGLTSGVTATYYFNAVATQFNIRPTNAGTVTVNNLALVEIAGNHATQATSAARPTLSARVNLLTKTEEFNDAAWQKTAITITANDTTAPDGTTTADKFVESNTSTSGTILATSATIALTNQRIVVSVKPSNTTWHIVGVFNNATSEYVLVWFNISTGVVGTSSTVGTAFSLVALSPSITAQANGFYQLGFTVSTTVTQAKIFSCSATADGGLTRVTSGTYWTWGADLRVANDTALPVYQRVNTATDYNATGFPYYLRFDGTDDSMATASIDFTATAQMSVFTGLRKLSDVGLANIIAELSDATTNNRYSMGGFLTPSTRYFTSSGGTLLSSNEVTNAAFSTPISNVLTGLADISSDLNQLRINGVLQASNTADQGTGNYPNAPLYIGRRAGATFQFNGRIYSLLVLGRAATATEITNTETWINGKTKAY
jgi:hypothetical protein